jgi:hypothetical protein
MKLLTNFSQFFVAASIISQEIPLIKEELALVFLYLFHVFQLTLFFLKKNN